MYYYSSVMCPYSISVCIIISWVPSWMGFCWCTKMKSALRYMAGLGKEDERLVPRKSFVVTNGSVKNPASTNCCLKCRCSWLSLFPIQVLTCCLQCSRWLALVYVNQYSQASSCVRSYVAKLCSQQLGDEQLMRWVTPAVQAPVLKISISHVENSWGEAQFAL